MDVRFLSRLNTRAGQLMLLGAVLGLGACSDTADVTVHSQDEGQAAADFVTQQGALEAPGIQSLVIDLDANDVATIGVSDILANIAGADPATFELLAATAESGASISLDSTAGEVTYTGNPAKGWDRFDYKVCELGDATVCETGVAHVVMRAGACAGLELSEDFRGTALIGDWEVGGSASPPNTYTANLTAAGPNPKDADGEGWLRQSTLVRGANGYAFLDEKFPASDGVSMTFELASWGQTNGTGGDGFLFFLVDGDEVGDGAGQDSFELGGCCGSLGYAPMSGDNAGMPHAVAGIAFDAYGNFWNGNEGRTPPDTLPPEAGGDDTKILPNTVVVRAGEAEDWKTLFVEQVDTDFLELTCDTAGCDTRPEELGAGRFLATITLTPKASNSQFQMEIYLKADENDPFVKVADTIIPQPLPDDLKLGLIGAAGGSHLSIHEVRNLSVNSVSDAEIVGTSSVPDGDPVSDGDEVTYTYTINNKTSGPICAADVNLVLPEGFTITDQDCVTEKPNDTCAGFGTEGVTSDTIALDGDGKVTITITGTVGHSSNNPSADASGDVDITGTQADSNPADNNFSSSHDFNEPTLGDRTLDILAGTSESFDVHDDVLGGDNIDFTTVDIDESNVPAGVEIDYDESTGDFTVTVDRDYTGPSTVEVSYTIDNDEGTSPPATVTINIADAMDGSVDGTSDGEIWVEAGTPSVDVPMTGSEPIGSATVTGGPTDSSSASSGSATSSGSTVTFTPDPGKEDDPDTYEIEVEVCAQADPDNCDVVEVVVVYNDAPEIDVPSGDEADAPLGRTTSLPFDTDAGDVGDIDPASIEITAGESDGCAVNSAGDAVEFTPTSGTVAGTEITCTLQVCEERPADLCTTQDFVFTTIQNFHPIGDSIDGAQGETSSVSIAELISNDGNADPDSFSLVGTPEGGSVSIVGGSVEFVADDGATDASFEYQICAAFDATECETVKVTVTLAEKPDGQDRTVWVLETATPAEVSVDSPFNDPTDNTVESVSNGSATIGPNGEILVTADPGYVGPVVVEVEGCTQTSVPACSTKTVTVIVNDLPTVDDGSAIVTPGSTQSISPVASANQAGAINMASLTLTSNASTPNGTCGIDVDNGKVTFEADAGATLGATATCTVEICELAPAGACASADFTFEVQDIFNPSDDDTTTLEGTEVEIITGDLTGNDGNHDPDSFDIVGTPDSNGAYETEEGGLLTPNDDGDGFIYTPPADFTGDDSFEYQICSGLDASDCEDVTVTIAVQEKTRITGPTDGAIIEDLTPTVTGTAQPNTEVDITVDGTVVDTVIVDEDGNWEWTPDDDLTPGDHTIGAEGDNGSSTEIEITLEEPIAPRAPVEITSPDDGSSTDDPLPTISGTGEPGAEITISVDGSPVGTVEVDEDGDWSWTFEDALPPGDYVVDATDEEGVSDSIELTVNDPSGPVYDFAILDPVDGSSTDNPRPTISGTGQPGSSVTITVDGEIVDTVTVDDDGEWSWTPETDMEPGPHTIDAEDEFGDSSSVEITVTAEGGGDTGPDAGGGDTGPDAGGGDAGPDAGGDDIDDIDEEPLEGVLTGGRLLGCAATGQSTPPVGFSLVALLAGGALLRRRRG